MLKSNPAVAYPQDNYNLADILLRLRILLQLYDRLSQVGVCVSYTTTLKLIDMVKGNINVKLIEAIKARKHFRMVGDNINFEVGVRDERKGCHKEMMNYFGSAILIRDLSFPEFDVVGPQLRSHAIKPDLFLLDAGDTEALIDDYAYMAMTLASEKIPFFMFLKHRLPKHLTDEYTAQLAQKTVVIPLAAIPRNEQYYGDTVAILR